MKKIYWSLVFLFLIIFTTVVHASEGNGNSSNEILRLGILAVIIVALVVLFRMVLKYRYEREIISILKTGSSEKKKTPLLLFVVVLILALLVMAIFFVIPREKQVTIIGGSGSGSYKKGETVNITAEVNEGCYFSEWIVENGDITISNPRAEETSLEVRNKNATVTAVIKKYPILKHGIEINKVLKELSGTDADVSKENETIESILYTRKAPPSGITTVDLSENDSPVLAWFDSASGTVYIQSDADKVYLNRHADMLFKYMKSLKRIDLSIFDTSFVTDMTLMFDGCSSLTELDLSSFDTSSVTKMIGMFSDCSSLTKLDLSNFDTASVMQMSGMFYGCDALTNVITQDQAILEKFKNK